MGLDSGHDHSSHEHAEAGGAQGRALAIALGVALMVFAIELVGGTVFGSLALLADAAHVFADVVVLAIALGAQRLARRPPSPAHSFGFRRAEVLAAQLNGVGLVCVSLWIIFEAFGRFGSGQQVQYTGLIAVAMVGLFANLGSALVLHRAPGNSMNVGAATLHTISDAAGSLGALIAGVLIAVVGWTWADPTASIVIAILVIISAARLVRDTTHLLLDGTPRHLDPETVKAVLRADDAVVEVHHVHIWALSPDSVALSAHIELGGELTLHQAQAQGIRLKALLVERFGVRHSTLELECHPCAPETNSH